MRILLCATALLLCLPAVASASEPVRAYQGTRTVVKTDHLYPALREGEGYGEKYTFDADFGARGSFYFSYTISNLGMGDHKMEAKGRLTVDDKTFKWKKELDEDEWSHSKSPFSIKAGPAVLEGEPKRLVMKAEDGSDAVEAVFKPIANAWRPMNGQIHFGKERKISDFTIFPLMKATVRYKLGGGDWKTIEGHAWGSHTWSELAIYDQARWTMEFRGINGDTAFYMREMGVTTEYGSVRIPFLLVTKGQELLVESFDYTFTPSQIMTDSEHENRYKVPESFTFVGKDATEPNIRQFRGKVTKKTFRKRKDMLAEMNAALRLVAGRYSKPVSYDYDSDYVVEIKVGDKVERIAGLGRYEVYHWNE